MKFTVSETNESPRNPGRSVLEFGEQLGNRECCEEDQGIPWLEHLEVLPSSNGT